MYKASSYKQTCPFSKKLNNVTITTSVLWMYSRLQFWLGCRCDSGVLEHEMKQGCCKFRQPGHGVSMGLQGFCFDWHHIETQKSILGVWYTIHLLVWCKLQVSNIYESMLDSSQWRWDQKIYRSEQTNKREFHFSPVYCPSKKFLPIWVVLTNFPIQYKFSMQETGTTELLNKNKTKSAYSISRKGYFMNIMESRMEVN